MTITFPQSVCFAFSPNYIEISGATGENKATVKVEGTEDKTFTVGIVGGKAKIYVSRWMQLLFGDPIAKNRTSSINFDVKIGSSTESHYSEHTVIWGSLEPVKRFGTIGSYVYDEEEKCFVRRVRWFKSFPFKLSVFENANTKFQTRYDENGYGADQTIQEDGYNDLFIHNMFQNAEQKIVLKFAGSGTASSVFDGTYDYTFGQLSEGMTLVRIVVDHNYCGHYFRWIDGLGQMQYYLFAHHSNAIKVKNGDSIDEDIKYSDTYYGGGKRCIGNEKEKTIRCCAMNLSKEEAEYVRSIAYSVFVDLYLGKDKNGEEIWIPCTISDGTFSNSEKAGMQDFEITAEVPTSQSQSL